MSFPCAGCRGAGTYPQHRSGIPILCWACDGRGVNDYPTWRDPATHIVYKQNGEGEPVNKSDLDRWITGNGGEDQYPKCRKCGGDVVSVPGSVGVCECCHETHRNVLPVGWECHKCGKVYSPSIRTCQPCSMQEATDDDGC